MNCPKCNRPMERDFRANLEKREVWDCFNDDCDHSMTVVKDELQAKVEQLEGENKVKEKRVQDLWRSTLAQVRQLEQQQKQIAKQAEEIEQLKKALWEYGSHSPADGITPICEKSKHERFPCTCGFYQALGFEQALVEKDKE